MKPEVFGINGSALEEAATELHSAAAIRNCTLIVKDGYIIYEKYDPWSDAESIYESDSMGKTAVAILIGIAEFQGLVDIDKPIATYGVDPTLADWNATGVDFFPQVTLRHLISQASGYGRVAPGEPPLRRRRRRRYRRQAWTQRCRRPPTG